MMTLHSTENDMTEEEFDSLFRTTYPRLYRLAYALLNDAEESRDVVSNVFTDLLERHRFNAQMTEGYLMATVRNRALDLLRHRQVEDEARHELLHEYRVYALPDRVHEERIRDIRRYIETELTPQTRRVLQLCYDEKRSYQDAADLLGVSVQAINKHISQALRKLREKFNNK